MTLRTLPPGIAPVLAVLLAGTFSGRGSLHPVSLTTEYRSNPLGLDTPAPRLSWQLKSDQRGERQSAYQVEVASSKEQLLRGKPDLWDSGKFPAGESLQILYGGSSLRSGQGVFWRVRVWDKDGSRQAWSDIARFEIGLLSDPEWLGQWIRRPGPRTESADMFKDDPAPLLRKEFELATGKHIKRARVYVSGLGYYELFLNGKRVGDHELDPGWTSYAKRVLYSTYDVTDQLRAGKNAIGAMLGNGWFNPVPMRMWGHINIRNHLTIGEPRLICQLMIDYADGTSDTIATDESWMVGDGPVLRNSVYLGEVYDARREQPGWASTGFDDSNWKAAVLATEPKLGNLRAQSAPPIRITRHLRPIKFTEPKPGVYIFDFGQNFAGWVKVRVRGPAGVHVKLRYGELLYPDGTLNGMTSVYGQIKGGGKDYRYDGNGPPKTAFQQDEYILRGSGDEVFKPHFTFHGFRYVEITGFPGKPEIDMLEGLRLNSDVTPVGSFECSNPLFNRIQEMVLWTELSNLFSVQSDCPHREKFGYGGDIVASSEMALLNFDMANFYGKVARDYLDAVRPNGGFTETAPFVGISDEGLGEGSGPIGWGTAEPLLLWQLYQYYGDRQLLEEQYEPTKRWIELLKSKAKDGILDNGISDHESLVPKPRALTGTAFYYFNLELFGRIAKVLVKTADEKEAEAEARKAREAFNRRFLNQQNGHYDSGSQACQAFALYFGMPTNSGGVHQSVRADQVMAALLADLKTWSNHLSTGIFGTKYLLFSLSDYGRADIAYNIVNQRTFPGWGYMLANGATTLWEHWAFSDNTFSHNHPMFGSVSEWFYKHVAGISPAPDAVGFNKIIIEPEPVGDLKWAKAHYDSVRGRVSVEWEKKNGEFNLRVRIPVGATATVSLPCGEPREVREGGRSIDRAKDVRFLEVRGGRTWVEIPSGNYDFVCRLK